MSNERIIWIDYLKGICIILMIVGHCFEMTTFLKIFIYSFHMPLFIILTGYNIKKSSNEFDVLSSIKKDFLHLIIPLIIVVFIYHFSYEKNMIDFFIGSFLTLIWSNIFGFVSNDGYFISGVGPVWFLMCLFVSKFIYRILLFMFKDNIRFFLILFLSIFGIFIGQSFFFPLCFDIALVFLIFLEVGHLYKKSEDRIYKYNKVIFLICLFTWFYLLTLGVRIEFVQRDYLLGISIIQSLCACYCIIILGKWLARINSNFKFLSFLGRNTLLILCIHSLEYQFFDYSAIIGNVYFAIVRVLMIILIVVIINRCCLRLRLG